MREQLPDYRLDPPETSLKQDTAEILFSRCAELEDIIIRHQREKEEIESELREMGYAV